MTQLLTPPAPLLTCLQESLPGQLLCNQGKEAGCLRCQALQGPPPQVSKPRGQWVQGKGLREVQPNAFDLLPLPNEMYMVKIQHRPLCLRETRLPSWPVCN